jgi:hypothetical protein
MTNTEIANKALGKIGGAGDSETGTGFISDINSATDKVAKQCATLLPQCIEKVIIDLASLQCPFRETLRYADLGAEVADEDLPETGEWIYAFNVPGDCLAIVTQFNEDSLGSDEVRTEYKFDKILNKGNSGLLLLTNNLTNTDGTSAFIDYVINQTNTVVFSMPFIECIATLLAAELCPLLGKKYEMRQTILIEYKQLSIPAAQTFNQSQFNNYAKTVDSYLGGRE